MDRQASGQAPLSTCPHSGTNGPRTTQHMLSVTGTTIYIVQSVYLVYHDLASRFSQWCGRTPERWGSKEMVARSPRQASRPAVVAASPWPRSSSVRRPSSSRTRTRRPFTSTYSRHTSPLSLPLPSHALLLVQASGATHLLFHSTAPTACLAVSSRIGVHQAEVHGL